jgi:carbonic anhydrase/acetyltransferase-like protein (isoleucine patch superfamily)
MNHDFPPNPYHPLTWVLGAPSIGSGTWIGPFTLIDAKHDSLTIGKGCNISTGAQILTHSTVRRCISEKEYNEIDHHPVIIEDYCFIGTNAVILMGATIGHHCVIGAGAVVTEHSIIPPYSIVCGVPGKITGSSKKFAKKSLQKK